MKKQVKEDLNIVGITFTFLLIITFLIYFKNYYLTLNSGQSFDWFLAGLYHFVIYASFSFFAPVVIWVVKKVPLRKHGEGWFLGVHLFISVVLAVTHLFFSALILYLLGLIPEILFERFIVKYIYSVIHFHVLIYWLIIGYKSYQNLKNDKYESVSHKTADKNVLQIKSNGTITWLDTAEIYYIKAYDHYQKVFTQDSSYILKDSMKNLELELMGTSLKRIHRSSIVNISKIKELDNSNALLTLNNGSVLKIGRSFKKELNRLIYLSCNE